MRIPLELLDSGLGKGILVYRQANKHSPPCLSTKIATETQQNNSV